MFLCSSRSQYAYDETWRLNECVNDANLIESFITATFTTHSIRRTVGGMVEVDFGQFDILTSAFCSGDF
jgi:hypothetical protein